MLLSKVQPLIAYHDTFMRKAIPPEERLALTLRFLATGMLTIVNMSQPSRFKYHKIITLYR